VTPLPGEHAGEGDGRWEAYGPACGMPPTRCRGTWLVVVLREGEPGAVPSGQARARDCRCLIACAVIAGTDGHHDRYWKPRLCTLRKLRRRQVAVRGRGGIFSRSGITSPDASRVNADSSAVSSASDPASPSSIASRACCSHERLHLRVRHLGRRGVEAISLWIPQALCEPHRMKAEYQTARRRQDPGAATQAISSCRGRLIPVARAGGPGDCRWLQGGSWVLR
jgi:hypothetical protein